MPPGAGSGSRGLPCPRACVLALPPVFFLFTLSHGTQDALDDVFKPNTSSLFLALFWICHCLPCGSGDTVNSVVGASPIHHRMVAVAVTPPQGRRPQRVHWTPGACPVFCCLDTQPRAPHIPARLTASVPPFHQRSPSCPSLPRPLSELQSSPTFWSASGLSFVLCLWHLPAGLLQLRLLCPLGWKH